ncbi:hypothetical protein PRVXH_000451 [Proteinivorax hydrogeniformans]|uniref:Membrane protein YesL n=1 Tax=Proteinivorax hydrogeniformans TaxID=1826727 RepID=A0AAU8HUU5_9FIRM
MPTIIIGPIISLGMCNVALRAARNEHFTISSIFETNGQYGKAFGFFALAVLLIAIGLIAIVAIALTISPFVILIFVAALLLCIVFFLFVYWLLADTHVDLDFYDIITDSIGIAKENFLKVVAIIIITAALDVFAIIGEVAELYPLLLFRIFTIPITFLIVTHMYLDLYHTDTDKTV